MPRRSSSQGGRGRGEGGCNIIIYYFVARPEGGGNIIVWVRGGLTGRGEGEEDYHE